MASSKSLPFLIIAGIILAAAVVWNVFFNESTVGKTTTKANTEVVSNKAVVEAKSNTAKAPKTNQTTTNQSKPVAVIPDPYAHLEGLPREELAAEAKKIGASHMKFAMRYKTADQALKALQTFRDLEQYQKADELVGFMQQAFPETQIPSELLD